MQPHRLRLSGMLSRKCRRILVVEYHDARKIWQNSYKCICESMLYGRICTRMFVCIVLYACTYVCTYVCMYVCMYACMHECNIALLHAPKEVSRGEHTGPAYLCAYTYTYTYTYT